MAEILNPSIHCTYIRIYFGLQTCNKSLLLAMLSPLPATLHQHPTRYQTRTCSGRIYVYRGHLIFMESPFSQRVEGPTLLLLPPEERLLRGRSSAEENPPPGEKRRRKSLGGGAKEPFHFQKKKFPGKTLPAKASLFLRVQSCNFEKYSGELSARTT